MQVERNNSAISSSEPPSRTLQIESRSSSDGASAVATGAVTVTLRHAPLDKVRKGDLTTLSIYLSIYFCLCFSLSFSVSILPSLPGFASIFVFM